MALHRVDDLNEAAHPNEVRAVACSRAGLRMGQGGAEQDGQLCEDSRPGGTEGAGIIQRGPIPIRPQYGRSFGSRLACHTESTCTSVAVDA